MQDEGGGDLAAEPARVGAELDERGRDALEEQTVKDPGITLGERVELVGKCKHEMEIGYRQELGAPGAKPAFLRQGLALRAMPVAAGVVGVALRTTRITLGKVTAQRFCAAGRNRPHCPMLHGHECMGCAIRSTVALEDVCELESALLPHPRAADARPPQALRRRTHSLEQVQR